MKNVRQDEWETLIEQDSNAVVLDVRTEDECAEGMLPNAVCINFFEREHFFDEMRKLDRDKNYYVYCRSGNRSGMACQFMESFGFENTINLNGGLLLWKGDLK
ncbi:rhodanese-like domain-containing protein [Flavobacterium alkalisoli]|uniref:Rhodanese-like domain-containing protein n=1 Tax=Flavobacterium alkalisoli TaxID=2602769 RepID=A0A5B9FY39_9FLAO|nr:rhodanese-like domain-containing protein [Flavobacterium alkalisoli]QEE49762.1 rhodanese-like domain-containing protein [Flavobacterium alkalisoli]